MLVELLNAQTQVGDMVEAMRRDGVEAGSIAAGEQQLLALSGLQRQLAEGLVSPGALQQAIAASLAASANVAQQGRAHAATVREAEITALQAASAEARRTTAEFVHDFYEKRIFDPFLHFDTPEDERAYREREAEREKAIKEAQVENTPESNHRAAQLGQEQLEDAGQHGATQSPEYAAWKDRFNSVNAAFEASKPQPQKAAIASHDPLEDIPAAMNVDPDIVKAFQLAGVVETDPSLRGHGVNRSPAVDGTLQRGLT